MAPDKLMSILAHLDPADAVAMLAMLDPAAQAALLASMSPEEAARLLMAMDPAAAAAVLALMDPEAARLAIAGMDPALAAAAMALMDPSVSAMLLEGMDAAAAAGLLGLMDPEVAAKLLAAMDPAVAAALLAEMDPALAERILSNMDEALCLELLANMDPAAAARILDAMDPAARERCLMGLKERGCDLGGPRLDAHSEALGTLFSGVLKLVGAKVLKVAPASAHAAGQAATELAQWLGGSQLRQLYAPLLSAMEQAGGAKEVLRHLLPEPGPGSVEHRPPAHAAVPSGALKVTGTEDTEGVSHGNEELEKIRTALEQADREIELSSSAQHAVQAYTYKGLGDNQDVMCMIEDVEEDAVRSALLHLLRESDELLTTESFNFGHLQGRAEMLLAWVTALGLSRRATSFAEEGIKAMTSFVHVVLRRDEKLEGLVHSILSNLSNKTVSMSITDSMFIAKLLSDESLARVKSQTAFYGLVGKLCTYMSAHYGIEGMLCEMCYDSEFDIDGRDDPDTYDDNVLMCQEVTENFPMSVAVDSYLPQDPATEHYVACNSGTAAQIQRSGKAGLVVPIIMADGTPLMVCGSMYGTFTYMGSPESVASAEKDLALIGPALTKTIEKVKHILQDELNSMIRDNDTHRNSTMTAAASEVPVDALATLNGKKSALEKMLRGNRQLVGMLAELKRYNITSHTVVAIVSTLLMLLGNELVTQMMMDKGLPAPHLEFQLKALWDAARSGMMISPKAAKRKGKADQVDDKQGHGNMITQMIEFNPTVDFDSDVLEKIRSTISELSPEKVKKTSKAAGILYEWVLIVLELFSEIK
ncbi:hypothetical protein CYMTET_33645 [Cymbomonas tetramitiformis]|uniref:Magnesium transporter MgtE intracellular domain-containing protein n=1 Tax=Cymbomonas tetramitiformis TaxID=36881 RepID=A0AAE0FCK6_9CHLO|nr:hypothetical protein CYMTET_33645 [Cymbomonas tetramitiformis]